MKKKIVDDATISGACDAAGAYLLAQQLGYRVKSLSARGQTPGEGTITFPEGVTIPENHLAWIQAAGVAGIRTFAGMSGQRFIATLKREAPRGISGNRPPNFDLMMKRHWRPFSRMLRALVHAARDADAGIGNGVVDPNNLPPNTTDLNGVQALLANLVGQSPETVSNALVSQIGSFGDNDLDSFAAACSQILEQDPNGDLAELAKESAALARQEKDSRMADPSITPFGSTGAMSARSRLAAIPPPAPTDDTVHPLLASAVALHQRRNAVMKMLCDGIAPHVADQLAKHLGSLSATDDADEIEVGQTMLRMLATTPPGDATGGGEDDTDADDVDDTDGEGVGLALRQGRR